MDQACARTRERRGLRTYVTLYPQYPAAEYFKDYEGVVRDAVAELASRARSSSKARENWTRFVALGKSDSFYADVRVIEYVMRPFHVAVKRAQDMRATLSDVWVIVNQLVLDMAALERGGGMPMNGKPILRGDEVESVIHSIIEVWAAFFVWNARSRGRATEHYADHACVRVRAEGGEAALDGSVGYRDRPRPAVQPCRPGDNVSAARCSNQGGVYGPL